MIVPGVAPNSLTSWDWRDEFAGTPWHKHVPARIEAVGARAPCGSINQMGPGKATFAGR